MVPKVREGLTRTQLREIGAELAEAKERAPRRAQQQSAEEDHRGGHLLNP